jgi:transcription termination factor Rho
VTQIILRKQKFPRGNDLQKMNVLRRIIAPMGTMDAIEFINSKLKDTKNNAEFFNSMNKPA